MIRDTLTQLPLWLKILAISVTLLTLVATGEWIALKWKSWRQRNSRPMYFTCGHGIGNELPCGRNFPSFWTDGPEPQRQKLKGWTKEGDHWYCPEHNAGQIPLPFNMESLNPKSDEAQRLADYLSRRADTY